MSKTAPDGAAKAPRQMRPRIQDVAKLAGVSLGSVSAVLNGKNAVSSATRARIEAAIRELGYQPSLYASNLARQHTQVFGVIVSDLRIPFFAEAAHALESEAAQHGYTVSLATTSFAPARHRAAVQQLLAARIAGLAVYTSERDHEASAMIAASGVRSVFLDVGEASENSTNIQVDSSGGMRAAVQHLIELGHRDLLYVRNSTQIGEEQLVSHVARDAGFAAALRSRRLQPVNVRTIDLPGPAPEAGEQAIADAVSGPAFTAVICVTDLVAMGVYRGLQARGLRVPEDVSVIGFDNSYFCRFLNPPLTTVDISREALSERTVEALLQEKREAGGVQISLPTTLVVRDSTARPRHDARPIERAGIGG